MADRQDQRVGDGAQAIQAGGNVTIGLSSDQIAAILAQVVQLGVKWQAEALDLADKRMDEIRSELVERFTTGRANPEALREPDFQYMLGEAQEAYARSGEAAVRETLVDIISRRSKSESHSREALALNDAAARAPKLTKNEFAALSLTYICIYTARSISTPMAFAEYVKRSVMPFVKDATKEMASYWHLESQSCATLETAGPNLRDVWATSYGGVLGRGFTMEVALSSTPGKSQALQSTLIPCLRDDSKFQPNAISEEAYLAKYRTSGLTEKELKNVWFMFGGTIPRKEDLVLMLEPEIPGIAALFDLWDSPLKNLQLTSAGIAIAHANAVRVIGFEAPLSVWLR